VADAAKPNAKVIPIATAQDRAAVVRAFLAKHEASGAVLKITNTREALSYGDQWRRQAERMEALLILTTAQRDAADLLLRLCEEERDHLKALLGR